MELSLGMQIPLEHLKNASDPEQVASLLASHYKDDLKQMKKDYQSLVDSFPKSPSEVNNVQKDNRERGLDKAQAIIDKWGKDKLETPAEVDKHMVFRHFEGVISEATALEKLPDMISVRQRLQEVEKQFPKSPSDVLKKELERIALMPMDFDLLTGRLFRSMP
jgi:hypothetical protein